MNKRLLTKEGWTGLVAAFLALLGALLTAFLPPEWQGIIPLIVAAVEAILLIVIYILGRQTAKRFWGGIETRTRRGRRAPACCLNYSESSKDTPSLATGSHLRYYP